MSKFEKAAKRCLALSKKYRGLWFVVCEAGEFHVLSELEAFDQWCVHDHQIKASCIDGEFCD